jgi:hypothetical protein
MPLIMFVSSSFNTYVNLPKKKIHWLRTWLIAFEMVANDAYGVSLTLALTWWNQSVENELD